MIVVTVEQVVGTEDRERTIVMLALPRPGDLVELPEATGFELKPGPLYLGPLRGTVSHVRWVDPATLGLEQLEGVEGADLVPVVVLVTVPVAG